MAANKTLKLSPRPAAEPPEYSNDITTDTVPVVALLPPINTYCYSTPNPQVHGTGTFVATLPAKERAAADCEIWPSHRPLWHPDSLNVGFLFEDNTIFKKQRKGGSISLIYEHKLRQRGIHGYDLTFLDDAICNADGIGFVFASRVPCSKNIKRLWSIFVSRAGRVAKRMGDRLVRSNDRELPPFALGQTISLAVDLNLYRASFQTFSQRGVLLGRCQVDLSDMAALVDCSTGYLCTAITEEGMTVKIRESSEHPAVILSLPIVKPPTTPFRQHTRQPFDDHHHYYRPSTYRGYDHPDIPALVYPAPLVEEVGPTVMPSFFSNAWGDDFASSVSYHPTTTRAIDPAHYSSVFQPTDTSDIQRDSIVGTAQEYEPDPISATGLFQALGIMSDPFELSPQYIQMQSGDNSWLAPHDPTYQETEKLQILRDANPWGPEAQSALESLCSQNAEQDPDILSLQNRGISVSSDSSVMIGTSSEEMLSAEALALLSQLERWPINEPMDPVETVQPAPNNRGPADEEYQVPCLLEGNRTVSAPPAPRS